MQPTRRRPIRYLLGALALLVVVGMVVGLVVVLSNRNKAAPPVAGGPRPSVPLRPRAGALRANAVDVLALGATLTEKTSQTEALPVGLLQTSINFINVSLGANGTSSPEPSPGVFDWSSLDARMAQVAPLASTVTMRVFDAPDWMKPAKGKDVAVSPQHYQDFANLVLAAARRYPQIHYFAIWNEMFGYRARDSAWSYQAYTNMYNVVYTTLKSFNASLKVGGPYVPFAPAGGHAHKSTLSGPWGYIDQNALDTVTYWLQHKTGADFVAIDGRTADPGVTPQQPVAATELFSAVTDWVKQQTTLPIWWMEWYARSPDLGQTEWDAISAYALMQLAASGANAAFLWDPEYIPNQSITTPGLLVRGTGAGTALAPVFEALRNKLFQSTVTLASPVAGVVVLRNTSHYVAVDIDGLAHTTTILGAAVPLSPWQIATG
ncbi:MAG: hypothetical protein M3N98_04500 [Actinomycetota bacterium]|nr:hypothetical protein [Actinomycetota bacterium]